VQVQKSRKGEGGKLTLDRGIKEIKRTNIGEVEAINGGEGKEVWETGGGKTKGVARGKLAVNFPCNKGGEVGAATNSRGYAGRQV